MTRIKVSGMKCMGCVSAVRDALQALPDVGDVEVDLDKGQAAYSGSLGVAQAAQAVTDAGYPAEPLDE